MGLDQASSYCMLGSTVVLFKVRQMSDHVHENLYTAAILCGHNYSSYFIIQYATKECKNKHKRTQRHKEIKQRIKTQVQVDALCAVFRAIGAQNPSLG